ncbi:MAG TPA: hypothetical protein VI653_17460, partial [Steroidobacteraceae bacterium]
MAESTQTDSLWGQTFEIAVKRGALLALFEARLSSPDEPGLDDWRRLAAADVYAALASALSESDPNQKASTRETARHLFVMGLGLGQTAVREYLRRLPADVSRYVVRALWCPLQMPQSEHDFEQESQRLLRAFCSTFAFAGTPDPASLGRGYPVWADFLLWLEPIDAGIDRQVLCLEISLNGLPEAVDFRVPAAHLEELSRHAWYLESRSVFSRVCAEVSGESFHFSPRMTHHLPNFTSRDKPLYKLCQAASYLCTMIRWLQSKQITDRAVRVRAISITQNGIESLGATFFGAPDPRQDLLASLGRAYRDTEKVPDADDQALIDHVRFAFDRICKALPQVLSRSLMALRGPPQPGVGLAFNCNEELTDFFNPMQPLDWRQALMGLRSDARLIRFLGREPQEAIAAVLHSGNDSTREVPLRDLHSAAVAAGIRAARPGELTVLGLEGNPGIGKTTAVANSLRAEEEGFLLLYVSPRIIINDDVVGKLARDERGRASGTLCLTTNSKLIASARPWSAAREGGSAGRQGPDGGPQAWVDGAVIVDGLATFRRPSSSILFLDPADKEDIEATQSGSSFRKRPETERQDRIEDRHSIGVLKTLALATRLALHENPSVNKVVLSAAMQGYRESTGERSTLLALSKLFENSVTVAAGLAERCRFARRIPTVVVMIDELTGDGAGAP